MLVQVTACEAVDTRILVWLRPSKQIRAPLYSVKQKRQRRWIVS
jgi:1,3-beta-glucan synthase